ncbi:MAG: hypothetical protein QOE63_1453 [Acidimicrobiaceae bacterium]
MRRLLRLVGLVLVVAGGIGMTATAGRAQSIASYSVRARADSVGVQLIADQAPVVSIGGGEVAFITPASTQSQLDSLAGSTSFASAPYPGDLVVSLPGTSAGLFGGVGFPVPSYPFYVSSSYPTEPSSRQDAGPYSITSASSQDATAADAAIGLSTAPPQVVSITSHTAASREVDSSRVIAEASTDVAPLALSDIIRVGEIKATATAELDPSTPGSGVTKTSSLSIGTITIAGIELGLTDKGLVVAGNPLLPVDLTPVASLLASLGVQLEYVPSIETDSSITSAAVRISFVQDLPNLGKTTVRLVLGQVSASAGAGSSGLQVAPVPPVLPPAPAKAAAVAPSSAGGGSAGTGAGGVVVAAPTSTGSATVSEPIAAAQVVPFADLWLFYPALVGGGIVALTSSRASAWQVLRRRLAVASA